MEGDVCVVVTVSDRRISCCALYMWKAKLGVHFWNWLLLYGLAQVEPIEKQIHAENDAIELILLSSLTIITEKDYLNKSRNTQQLLPLISYKHAATSIKTESSFIAWLAYYSDWYITCVTLTHRGGLTSLKGSVGCLTVEKTGSRLLITPKPPRSCNSHLQTPNTSSLWRPAGESHGQEISVN